MVWFGWGFGVGLVGFVGLVLSGWVLGFGWLGVSAIHPGKETLYEAYVRLKDSTRKYFEILIFKI